MGSPYQFLFKKVKHQSKALSGSLFYATDEKDKGNPPPASFIKNTENTFITTFCLIKAFYEINYRLNSYN